MTASPPGTANPFESTASAALQRGVFGTARLLKSSFLYRVIEYDSPSSSARCRLVWDAWWFRQKITVDGHLAWFRISWLTIRRKVSFTIPAMQGGDPQQGYLEIEFGNGLKVRRFRIWIDEMLVYDEVG